MNTGEGRDAEGGPREGEEKEEGGKILGVFIFDDKFRLRGVGAIIAGPLHIRIDYQILKEK